MKIHTKTVRKWGVHVWRLKTQRYQYTTTFHLLIFWPFSCPPKCVQWRARVRCTFYWVLLSGCKQDDASLRKDETRPTLSHCLFPRVLITQRMNLSQYTLSENRINRNKNASEKYQKSSLYAFLNMAFTGRDVTEILFVTRRSLDYLALTPRPNSVNHNRIRPGVCCHSVRVCKWYVGCSIPIVAKTTANPYLCSLSPCKVNFAFVVRWWLAIFQKTSR